MLVALDVGGTKIAVATAAVSGAERIVLGEVTRHSSGDHPDLAQLIKTRLTHGHSPRAVGIGVAGPVTGRVVKLTNLPWSIDADHLEKILGCPVLLMNDLEAYGWAVAQASSEDLITLQEGRPQPGNRALIAAGTGLGEAALFWHQDQFIPSASEGGHTSFAPTSQDEAELLTYLLKRYTHVSWERVVSGIDGFRNLIGFLHASGRIELAAAFAEQATMERELGPLVSKAAEAGEEWAKVVLDWFVRLYGAEAGNLALKTMAVGGVYIGGGIALKIFPWLRQGGFVKAFCAKGRFADFLRDIPIYVVKDEHAPLKGAAYAALRASLKNSHGTMPFATR